MTGRAVANTFLRLGSNTIRNQGNSLLSKPPRIPLCLGMMCTRVAPFEPDQENRQAPSQNLPRNPNRSQVNRFRKVNCYGLVGLEGDRRNLLPVQRNGNPNRSPQRPSRCPPQMPSQRRRHNNQDLSLNLLQQRRRHQIIPVQGHPLRKPKRPRHHHLLPQHPQHRKRTPRRFSMISPVTVPMSFPSTRGRRSRSCREKAMVRTSLFIYHPLYLFRLFFELTQ